jgi:hypothetical protein
MFYLIKKYWIYIYRKFRKKKKNFFIYNTWEKKRRIMSLVTRLPRVSINDEHYRNFERPNTGMSLEKSLRNISPPKSKLSARTSTHRQTTRSSRKSTALTEITCKSMWDKTDYRTLSYEKIASINWIKFCQIKPVHVPLKMRNCFSITKCELNMSINTWDKNRVFAM